MLILAIPILIPPHTAFSSTHLPPIYKCSRTDSSPTGSLPTNYPVASLVEVYWDSHKILTRREVQAAYQLPTGQPHTLFYPHMPIPVFDLLAISRRITIPLYPQYLGVATDIEYPSSAKSRAAALSRASYTATCIDPRRHHRTATARQCIKKHIVAETQQLLCQHQFHFMHIGRPTQARERPKQCEAPHYTPTPHFVHTPLTC